MSESEDEVLRFIAASFPSVWALELLLVLKRERRSWTHQELITVLRASDLVVSKAIDALIAAGLASADDDSVIYLPVDERTAKLIDRAEQLYRTRANLVRRSIVTASSSSVTAFANAFKIRKGQG